MRGIGWLHVAVIIGCGTYGTAASANCVLVGLGSATSLMTCSGGARGTVIELGSGLGSYHLSDGSSGMINLYTAATGANAASPATSAPASAPGASLVFIVNGANGTPKTAAPEHHGAPVAMPLNPPLTHPMTNIANNGIAGSAMSREPSAPAGANPR